MGEIKHSRPVRNLKKSIKRWAESDEVEDFKKLDEKFWASPEGQSLKHEWEDVFHVLDEAVYHNDSGFHIHNEDMQHLEDELDDVQAEYEQLEGSKWDKAYDKSWDAMTHNR